MTAIQYLLQIPREWLPWSVETPKQRPTNSELRRWLRNKSVQINGTRPAEHDDVGSRVWECVFFPKSERRCTFWFEPITFETLGIQGDS